MIQKAKWIYIFIYRGDWGKKATELEALWHPILEPITALFITDNQERNGQFEITQESNFKLSYSTSKDVLFKLHIGIPSTIHSLYIH